MSIMYKPVGIYDRKSINQYQAEEAHVTFSKNSFPLKIAKVTGDFSFSDSFRFPVVTLKNRELLQSIFPKFLNKVLKRLFCRTSTNDCFQPSRNVM